MSTVEFHIQGSPLPSHHRPSLNVQKNVVRRVLLYQLNTICFMEYDSLKVEQPFMTDLASMVSFSSVITGSEM